MAPKDVCSLFIILGFSLGMGIFTNFFILLPKVVKIVDGEGIPLEKFKKNIFLLTLFSLFLVVMGFIVLRTPFPYSLGLVSLLYILFFFRIYRGIKIRKSLIDRLMEVVIGVLFFSAEALRTGGLDSFPSHFFYPFCGLFCLEIISGSYLLFLLVFPPLVEGGAHGRKLLSFSFAYLGKLLDLPMGLFFLCLIWFSFEVSLYCSSFFSTIPWFLILSCLPIFFRIYHQFFAEPNSTGILMRSLGPNHFCSSFITAFPRSKISFFSVSSYVLECWTVWILLFLLSFRGTSLFSFSSTLLPFQEQATGQTTAVFFSFNPFSPLPFKLQFIDPQKSTPHLPESLVVVLKERAIAYHVVAPSIKKEKNATFNFSASNFSNPGNWELKVMAKTEKEGIFHPELTFTIRLPPGWNPYKDLTFPSSFFFAFFCSLGFIFLFLYLYRFSSLFTQAAKTWSKEDREAKILISYLGPSFSSRLTTFCSALFILGIAFLF
ncbi:hypothetical protein EM20IM_01540 [Candidatus Methylacidiphilum infernorum]|uniref:Uncharacterized protein n=1 Tax=Candidatus Methylacidiphilum infernorum TaxID=511746 RepID=A0ABX7PWX4_9BACT|nr:hypothetical protein [Candidatus Methylacidiphilum infernorum]QSR87071.1 hypothetical protein EM20IM_01540 [Candidatus Methylacidiphilum infernorum]